MRTVGACRCVCVRGPYGALPQVIRVVLVVLGYTGIMEKKMETTITGLDRGTLHWGSGWDKRDRCGILLYFERRYSVCGSDWL